MTDERVCGGCKFFLAEEEMCGDPEMDILIKAYKLNREPLPRIIKKVNKNSMFEDCWQPKEKA